MASEGAAVEGASADAGNAATAAASPVAASPGEEHRNLRVLAKRFGDLQRTMGAAANADSSTTADTAADGAPDSAAADAAGAGAAGAGAAGADSVAGGDGGRKARVAGQAEAMSVAEFAHACDGISRLFSLLGIAFAFAGKDFTDKVKDLTAAGKEFSTLGSMVDADVSKGSVKVQNSHTRNLLRVLRGLDMMRRLFCYILDDCMKPLREHASRAYSEVFSAHHSWAIRSLVAAGMYALPSTDNFLHHLGEDEESWREPSSEFVTSVTDVAAAVEDLFVSRDLGLDCSSPPRTRRLEPDPFARLSDDLVAHILALVASNGFRFHPKPCLTTAAATSDAATTASAAAAFADSAAVEANAVGDGSNGAVSSEDYDALGEKGEDEMLERIERAVKKPCARFVRVVELTEAIALEAAATAANYARTMTLHLDPDDPHTPSAAHILASAFPPSLSEARTTSAPLPPPLPPPPFTVFRHALVCKRWLRLARFSLPAILLQADRRLSTQTFRSVLSSAPPPSPSSPPIPLSLSLAPPTPEPASAVSPAFPLHSPLTLQHLHIGPSALDAITDDLLHSIATGCARSLTHLSLYRHMNLRSWERNRGSIDPDDAVAKVTEPAVTALFAACRRLVSLKLTLPLCLPELPASVSLLQRLTRLEVSCGRLDPHIRAVADGDAATALEPTPQPRFPEGVGSLSALRSLSIRAPCVRALPHTLSRLRSLTSLKIVGCSSLRQLPDGLGQLKKLQYLELAGSSSMDSLPDSIGLLSSLETLHLFALNADFLPDSFAHLSSLKRLFITNLSRLQSLPDGIGELPSLQVLNITSCSLLAALPPSISALSSLTALTVYNCAALASLPEDIGDVPSLASLVLNYLNSLTAIPDSLALLSSLTHLHAANCRVLTRLPASFAGMHSLSRLQLLKCPLRSLPEDIGQLSALTELHLNKVLDVQECENLSELPEGLESARSLRELHVDGCNELEDLPEPIMARAGRIQLHAI
ncbi:unnamed protein product [Closterium sp. Naga37s-1]|nr:unnamed protein product [Closterium sp. Naga37s-1]